MFTVIHNINFNFDSHIDIPNKINQTNNNQEQDSFDYEAEIKYFSNANYDGPSHVTKLSRNSCHKVLDDFKATEGISSFELNDHCVLAYKTTDCSGDKIFVVPGHCDNLATPVCFNDQIKSLKLC